MIDHPCAKQMGVAAIVHIYVFPAKPYENGERCVRNVSVMSDYASLGSPPDRSHQLHPSVISFSLQCISFTSLVFNNPWLSSYARKFLILKHLIHMKFNEN